MPNYYTMANAQLPNMGEIAARMKAKRAARKGSAGDTPADATGEQRSVMLPGEAPIQAQGVSGQQPVGVTIGAPQMQQAPSQSYQMQPMQFQVRGQPQQQPINAQANMDPRAARVRALMSQGLSYEQAMQKVQAGG
jgi:hypothetical protein